MRVRFTAPYIFTPDENRMTARKYPLGWEGTVRQQCAEKAIAAGVAIELPDPPRRRRKRGE